MEVPDELERLARTSNYQLHLADARVKDVALIERGIGTASEHRQRAQGLAALPAIVLLADGVVADACAVLAGVTADRRALLAVPSWSWRATELLPMPDAGSGASRSISPRTIVIVSLSGNVSRGEASGFGCTACPLNVREHPTIDTTATTNPQKPHI